MTHLITHCTKPTTKHKINQTDPPVTPKTITCNPTKPESIKPRATTAYQTNLKKKPKTKQTHFNNSKSNKPILINTNHKKSNKFTKIKHKSCGEIERRTAKEREKLSWVRTKTIGEQKPAGGGVGDATMPLEKKSQASESEREECEEEEELLWLPHLRERERERECVVVESFKKRKKKKRWVLLQNCHRSFV